MRRPMPLRLMILLFVFALFPFKNQNIAAQSGSTPAPVFTEYTANPILTLGAEGEWDSLLIGAPHIVYDEGRFHLFYIGAGDSFRSVGYATSEDGFNFTKHENNPLIGQEVLEDRMLEFIVGDCGFSGLSVVRETDHWRMYLSPNACGLDAWSPGGYVLIADAPALSGPWAIQVTDDYDEAFFAGSGDDWDKGGITVDSVVPTDEGYVLYYSGLFDTRLVGGSSIGRATSSDGRTWVKHHGPAPDSGHYTASSPVLTYGPREDWDNFYIQRAAVRHTENGWQMFYSGSRIVNDPNPNNRRGLHSIGYAHSSDGIAWVPYPEPILSAGDGREYEFSTFVIVDGTYYLYYNYISVAGRTRSIGVATGTIDWVESADAAAARGVLPPIPFPPGPVGLPEIEVYGAVDGRVSIEALTEPGAWEAIERAASYLVEYRPLAGSGAGSGSENENFLSPSFVDFIRRLGPGEYWFTITARSQSQEMLAYTELIVYIEPEDGD